MKILAIDTSNQTMSVALLEDEKPLASYTSSVNKNHSVTLMPVIETLFKQNKVKPSEIDRVVVAKGPGSYTGLRIGITTAKTLAWTLKADLVGVSSLAHLASMVPDKKALIIPLFDARRGNVYTGGYKWLEGQLEEVMVDCHVSLALWLEELKKLEEPIYFVGDLPEVLVQLIKEVFIEKNYEIESMPLFNSINLGRLGLNLSVTESAEAFVPTYLKLVEAEENWLATNPIQRDHYVEKI